ncbi:MAG: protoporphyrinogen oxidase [Thermomicrobiales bacterium]|nr:protoporphyrinogen oxidase [Thermomicrobiales bacterium]
MTTADQRPPVVVIGGGITGLAAAYRLAREAPHTRITLIEADERLGGKIATEYRDGFVIEAGPDSFLASKPRGAGLAAELGLGDRLQGVTPQPKRAFILFRGRLHDLPEGLTGLVPTRLGPLARSTLLSPAGKARVALDYLLPARDGDDDESLGAFVRRRLGNEAWERLVEPLMSGIYAADGDRLSLAATFPQLRQAERSHGGLIRGVLAARKGTAQAGSTPRSPFLTPVGGLGEIVAALERELRARDVTIRTGVMATRVARDDASYVVEIEDGETLRADTIIVATPAFAAAALLSRLDSAMGGDLAAIPYASTAIVSLAYRREAIPHALPGHGYVVPRVEGGPILAGTWSSRKWAERAPEGWELLRVFIGRAGPLEAELAALDDERLVGIARQELTARLGVSAPPALAIVRRWTRGMPQYLLGHPERVARIERRAREHPGLFLAGAAFHGVGLPDCIASGERAAEAAIAFLARDDALPPIRGSGIARATP